MLLKSPNPTFDISLDNMSIRSLIMKDIPVHIIKNTTKGVDWDMNLGSESSK